VDKEAQEARKIDDKMADLLEKLNRKGQAREKRVCPTCGGPIRKERKPKKGETENEM